jgi:hypothetical protein
MVFKKFGPVRYPYTGDIYSAEGKYRIRVERDGKWGYFDDRGTWLEGELRHAEPCMCRFLSSTWVIDNAPADYGLIPAGSPDAAPARPRARRATPKARAKTPPRKTPKKTAKKASRGRSK